MSKSLLKKGTDGSVPAYKMFMPRRTVAVDRVVCPLFQQTSNHNTASQADRAGEILRGAHPTELRRHSFQPTEVHAAATVQP